MPEGVVIQSAEEIQDREDYKRRLLFETKRLIDDKTSLETLLRILQNYYEEYQSLYDSWEIAYKIYTIWLPRFISKLCWWT
ncbi:MAG TPA: hypothetical protein VH500_25240 [Nitrososphaeraceae archaeon]|jgi:hypothetical protein